MRKSRSVCAAGDISLFDSAIYPIIQYGESFGGK